MILVGHVADLRQYPVKSMQGAVVPALEIGYPGVVGDRGLVLTNSRNKQVLTAKAKRAGGLLDCAARLEEGSVLVRHASGEWRYWTDPLLTAELADCLDLDVQLRRNAYTQVPQLTNFGFSLRAGVGYDSSPVHLLTDVSLQTASHSAGPQNTWSLERFRPTMYLVLDSTFLTGLALADQRYPEDSWVSGTLVFPSGLMLLVTKRTKRCALVTRAQPIHDLNEDGGILRVLKEDHESNLGVYATVRYPGKVQVGDEVWFVPAGEALAA